MRQTMYDLRLSDPTLATWALLRQAWSFMNKAAETKLAKVHLTPEKLGVLWICRDFPGTITTAEISRYMSRQSQSITGLLNRMEQEGLIGRVPKRKGQPFTELKLTAKGQEACDAGASVIKALIEETAQVLSTGDREQLHGFLVALRDHMADMLHIELTPPPDVAPDETIDVRW
jgi:DNA-binding MarR family transcriptional regulator